MKYSMNLLLWGNQIDESLFPTLELIKEIGFDGVEVPIFNTNPEHWFKFRQKLDSLGLACETDTICGPSEHLISTDPAMRRHTKWKPSRSPQMLAPEPAIVYAWLAAS